MPNKDQGRGVTICGILLALEDMFRDRGSGEILSIRHTPGAVCRAVKTLKLCGKAAGRALMNGDTYVCHTVASAGYGPVNPDRPNPERVVSLADQLVRWFSAFGGPDSAMNIKTNLVAWGTASEIEAGIDWMIRKGVDPEDPNVILVTATNPSHWLRVWILCRKIKPRAWKMKVGMVWHKFSLWSALREIPKTICAMFGKYNIRIADNS